ncbi:MAG: hypothetical protein D6722_09805 [Bacteroidetes bacterium]|nr:MAG: hypothetical protein D6722_09805 [Bacteroidota bacterium]
MKNLHISLFAMLLVLGFACMPITSRQEIEAKASKARNPTNIPLYFSEAEVPFAFEVVAEGQYWRLSIFASRAAAGKVAIKKAQKLNYRGMQIEAILLNDLYNIKFLRKTGELSQVSPPSTPAYVPQGTGEQPLPAGRSFSLFSGPKRLGLGIGLSSYGRRAEVIDDNGETLKLWFGTRAPMLSFQFALAPPSLPNLELTSGLRVMLPARYRLNGDLAFGSNVRLTRLQLEVLGRYFFTLPLVPEVRVYPLLGLQGGLVINDIRYSSYLGGAYLRNSFRMGLLTGAGAEYALADDLSVFGEFQGRFHQDYFNGYGLEVGVRKRI